MAKPPQLMLDMLFFAQAANDPYILMTVKKFLGHPHEARGTFSSLLSPKFRQSWWHQQVVCIGQMSQLSSYGFASLTISLFICFLHRLSEPHFYYL